MSLVVFSSSAQLPAPSVAFTIASPICQAFVITFPIPALIVPSASVTFW